jgi:hydrogenase nickel incorporation protein HypB
MIEQAIEDWELNTLDLLLIENVSNLSCPPHYDLGETAKIAVVSVTESVDEPLKHASLFLAAELMILNKADLLPSIQIMVSSTSAKFHKDLVTREE